MSFCPYIAFDGNCREAMTFYAGVFGATDLQFMNFSDAPPGTMTEDFKDKVMHSQFSLGGVPLMGSDAPRQLVPAAGRGQRLSRCQRQDRGRPRLWPSV